MSNFGIDARFVKDTDGKDLNSVNAQLAQIATLVPPPNGTDDTTAIQNAINTCNTNGGGIVELSAGTYLVTSTITIPSPKVQIIGAGKNTTIIQANATIDKIFSIAGTSQNNLMKLTIRDLSINGNSKANIGFYSTYTGMVWLDDLVIYNCLDKGIMLDVGSWMFRLTKIYLLNNTNYGVYVGSSCEGSKMDTVIAEQNGINLRIGYTRMIQIVGCTFQRFTAYGNVLVQGGWDITFDTNWFEAPTVTVSGETYDLNLQTNDPNVGGSIGHLIRLKNNSFHGVWGATGTSTKWCILDAYPDTLMIGNYVDASGGGYPGGNWYKNTQPNLKTIAFGNEINGSSANTTGYTLWQKTDGTSTDNTLYMKDVSVSGKFTKGTITSPTSIPNSGTVNTTGVDVAVVTGVSGGTTGAIMQAGTYGGQRITLINQSASSVTFAASASNVYPDSYALTNGNAKTFVWNSNNNLWYPA